MRSDVVRSSRVRGVSLGSILRHYVVVIHSQKPNLNPRKSALSVALLFICDAENKSQAGFYGPNSLFAGEPILLFTVG